MKNKLLLLSAMISASFLAAAEDVEVKTETIKVMVEKSDDGNVSKKVIMNGKELSTAEIKELEESGKINVLHIDEDIHGEHDGEMKKIIVIETEEEDSDGKHVKVIKKHLGDKHTWISKDGEEDMDVDVEIRKDGTKTIEKIIINGKELSADEIKAMKQSGELKVLHLDEDMKSAHGNKMIFIGDNKEGKHGKHVVSKKFVISDSSEDSDQGRLGFMANVEDDGWHVISVVDESGAKQAGIQEGDIIVRIGDKDLTKSNEDSKSIKLNKHKVGDKVRVKLTRDGKNLDVTVEAKTLNSEQMHNSEMKWVSEFEGDFDIDDMQSKMIFINKGGDFEFDEDDIHITFPESLKDMNIFISDGKSTSKLLGKRHKFSSMSNDLAEYFHTKDGVLVLSVDTKNVFGLKDGDVVKKVNGNIVKSPKAIIKELLKAADQKKITLKVVRHKKNKTLKAKL